MQCCIVVPFAIQRSNYELVRARSFCCTEFMTHHETSEERRASENFHLSAERRAAERCCARNGIGFVEWQTERRCRHCTIFRTKFQGLLEEHERTCEGGLVIEPDGSLWTLHHHYGVCNLKRCCAKLLCDAQAVPFFGD